MAAAGSRPFIDQTPGDYGDFYSCCSVLQKIMPCHFDAFFCDALTLHLKSPSSERLPL